VVPGVVSQFADGLSQGSVASEGGGSPAAVEAVGSVINLSTQNDALGRQVLCRTLSLMSAPFLQTYSSLLYFHRLPLGVWEA